MPLRSIATGGMGRVELAARREDGFVRLFAIKRLRAELEGDADARAMFLEEARIAGLIRHPNVVSVVDVGADDEGPFLVMEYVEGVSAAQLIVRADGRPLPLEICLRIGIDVAEGLHAAHELTGAHGKPLSLVHRDVSPQNILVGFDGVARVTDFGIARALDRVQKTTMGILKGKVGYMSPEQLRFEDVDRRADLFALGVVLYELLAGKRLYGGSEANEVARRVLGEPAPDLADDRDDADPELVELLFELLAKSREARPATARQVGHRLEAVLAPLLIERSVVRLDDYLRTHFAREFDRSRREISEAIATVEVPRFPWQRRTMLVGALTLASLGSAIAWSSLGARSKALERTPATEPRASLPSASPAHARAQVPGLVFRDAKPESASRIKSNDAGAGARAHRSSDTNGGRRPQGRTPPRPAGVPLWERY